MRIKNLIAGIMIFVMVICCFSQMSYALDGETNNAAAAENTEIEGMKSADTEAENAFKDDVDTTELEQMEVGEEAAGEISEETADCNIIISFYDPDTLLIRTALAEDIMNSLPDFELVEFANGTEGEVPAEWETIDIFQDGDDLHMMFRFIIPDGYLLANGVEPPVMEVIGVGFYEGTVNSTSDSRTDATLVGTGAISGETGDSSIIYFGTAAKVDGYHKIFVTFNGKKYVAYCIETDKDNPKGTETSVYRLENAYSSEANKKILKALYYGYTSDEDMTVSRFVTSGLADVVEEKLSTSDILYDWNNNEGVTKRKDKVYHFLTHIMLAKLWGYSEWNHNLSANEVAVVNQLITKLDSLPMPIDPTIKIVASDTQMEETVTAFVGASSGDSSKNVQRTKEFTIIGDSSNSVTLNLPDSVIAYVDGKPMTGTVKISCGAKFHLEAPLSMTGTYIQTDIKGVLTAKVQPYITFGGSDTISYGNQDLAFLFSENYSGTTSIKVNWVPQYGYLQLNKLSAEPGLTDDNSCYSLEGAVYTVYSDSKCTISDGTLKTDKNGISDILKLVPGTYYVKETTAAMGYQLDNTVYTVEVTPASTQTAPVKLEVKDVPASAPVCISIEKIINGEINEECPSLAGTQFTINYYEGYYTAENLPAESARSWVIETKAVDKDGEIVYMALLQENYKISGDEFYFVDGIINLPLGTVTIQETQAAPGYTLEGYLEDSNGNIISRDGEVYVTQVTYEGAAAVLKGGNEFWSYDTPFEGSIKIVKYNLDGETPLEGVSFALMDTNGNLVAKGTTDADGIWAFEGLYPDTYVLTETATVPGHTLLRDSIEITIPMKYTEADVSIHKVDTDKCIYNELENVYYVYDVTCEVSNGAALMLPLTGGTYSIWTWLPLICGFCILMDLLIKIINLLKVKKSSIML